MGQMLNRVRDFRYDEIKNWKPLVSLRESYRKESAFKNMILVATCLFAILIGYSVINGSLQVTARPPQSAQEAAGAAAGSGSRVAGGESRQTSSAAPRTDSRVDLGLETEGISPIPTIGGRGALQQVNYQKAATGNPTEPARDEAGRGGLLSTATPVSDRRPRVAVCDVQRILNTELANYAAALAAESERELRVEQETLYERSQFFSDVEVLILQKLFEQKKQLAVVEIRQRVQQYRELADRHLRAIADRVADEYNFDLVLTADQVLSFMQTADITRDVNDLWLEQKQIQAQRDRQSRMGIR